MVVCGMCVSYIVCDVCALMLCVWVCVCAHVRVCAVWSGLAHGTMEFLVLNSCICAWPVRGALLLRTHPLNAPLENGQVHLPGHSLLSTSLGNQVLQPRKRKAAGIEHLAHGSTASKCWVQDSDWNLLIIRNLIILHE